MNQPTFSAPKQHSVGLIQVIETPKIKSYLLECPDGWSKIDQTNRCYKLFYKYGITWMEAQNRCTMLGVSKNDLKILNLKLDLVRQTYEV